jgi:predicted dehydrogenase
VAEQITPIRLAVIGCGAIAEQLYLPVLTRIHECKLVNLIGLNLARARILPDHFNIEHYSQSVDNIQVYGVPSPQENSLRVGGVYA